jgi:hypothetical protein
MVQDLSSRGPHSNQQAIPESSYPVSQPSNHSPQAVQQLVIHGSRADQLPSHVSSRGQKVRAYYETDYTSRVVDRSSTSPPSQGDQWVKTEVKENMPVNGTTENVLIGNFHFAFTQIFFYPP